ncbi:MAG: filamentous hemagglutinin N-terminal domain-containing protein, partial [Candidatus Gastranaerophilales bacterium]|nr:filamentous hemagglutinin N-terminal domain-containing protein [Candidatus Gastranaerophilales bacterium]
MSQFKKKLTAFTAMLTFLTLSSAAAFAVSSGDVLGNTNNMNFHNTGNQFNVDLNSGMNGDVGQVDWKDFNVGKGEHVNFGFSGLSQTIINRVLGGNESQILGKLTNSCINNGTCESFANTSKVILINPAGIMFGQGSTVDLNSFTASTFDIKGIKNIQNMSADELSNYQQSTLNKFSPWANVNGENRDYGNIQFDSNYTEQFEKAGIRVVPGETNITLDGTTFAHFNADGSIADINPNKTTAIVSDNITYRDSVIKTGTNLNYQISNSSKSFSNARLITADGVTFKYVTNGYADDYEVAQDTKNVERNISIDNSGLAGNKVGIESGSVAIVNNSNADNSNIKISNAVIKGTKLINKENGDIMIIGSNDITLDNARLETVNTNTTVDGTTTTTENQNGGQVYLGAGKNVKIKDSLVYTAGAKAGTANATNAGSARIFASGGDIDVENSKIITEGNIKANAYGEVKADNTLLYANNSTDSSVTKYIELAGGSGVKGHNAAISASGDVDIKSVYSDNTLAGDIVLTSDLKDGQNQSLVTGKNVSIQGSDTRIDNVGLVYENLKFYNDGTTGLNNVTIANNTTFLDVDNGAASKDINVETNGNLTLDNATMQRAGYNLNFDRDGNKVIIDDGTPGAIDYTLSFEKGNANDVNVTSTEKNVIVTNNTNVVANKNINLTSNKGNVNVDKSNLKAKDENVNITASKGSVNIKDNSNVTAGKDVNVKAYNSITFGNKDAAGVNIDKTVKLTAGEDMNITSLNGDITGEKTTMPTLTYGDRLTFDAAGSNNFTSEDSLKAVNVDFKAGKANNITTKGDVQFVNSSLEAPNNNITTTQEGGDVIMNNLTIKQATANAKDTVTKINAKGNVTTKDVTGTATADAAAAAKTFPQSVNYDGNVTDKTTPDTVLDINQTKLIVE